MESITNSTANHAQALLDQIQKIKEDDIKIDLPFSFENPIFCKKLKFKQQKELISTIAEGNLAALKFQKALNDVLIENIQETLDIGDKITAAVTLRIGSLGDTLKVDGKDVWLGEIVNFNEPFRAKKQLNFRKSEVIKHLGLKVELIFPTLPQENKVITALLGMLKGDSNVAKSVGNIYTYEIVKYVSKITFGENVVDFTDLKVETRVELVENLPITINQSIVDFIQANKEMEREYLTVDVNGERRALEIDMSFFDS